MNVEAFILLCGLMLGMVFRGLRRYSARHAGAVSAIIHSTKLELGHTIAKDFIGCNRYILRLKVSINH
jgi:hypothetical protein